MAGSSCFHFTQASRHNPWPFIRANVHECASKSSGVRDPNPPLLLCKFDDTAIVSCYVL